MKRLAAAATLVAGLGCGGTAPPAPDLVAQIEGDPVAYASFESYLADNSADPELGWGSDVLSALFDQFLDEELLLRLAVERGLVDAGAGRRTAVEALLEEALAGAVGERDIAVYYRRHRSRFERPERVRVRQILLADRAGVDRALAELAAGAPFEEVAERHSQVPVGAIGGGDEALARSDLPPDFAEAIFELEPGEVSRAVATDYGFHLFQVVQRLPAGVTPLAAVADEIGASLRRDLAEQALGQLVREVRERYNVRLFERNLPFNYQGLYNDGSSAAPG